MPLPNTANKINEICAKISQLSKNKTTQLICDIVNVAPIYTPIELLECENDPVCENELKMINILKTTTYININEMFKYVTNLSDLTNNKLIFQNCNANGIRVNNNTDVIIPNTGKYQFIISSTTILDFADIDLIETYSIIVIVNNNILFTSSYIELIANAVGGGGSVAGGSVVGENDLNGSIEKYYNFNANDIINIYLVRSMDDNIDVFIQNFSIILKQL